MPTITSWNVNGIRAVNRNDGLSSYISSYSPDIICLQEIRCSDEHIQESIFNRFPDYEFTTIKCSLKKGYAGVAILSKYPFQDLSNSEFTFFEGKEGRINVAVFQQYILINTYTPNSQGQGTVRFIYRVQDWDMQFTNMVKKIKEKFPNKKVIVCGDFNVSHLDIDVYDHENEHIHKTAGFTKEERDNFSSLLRDSTMIDAYRSLYPSKKAFTWWSNFNQARQKDRGMRLDYFVVPNDDAFIIEDVIIHKEVMGSDHAPIELKFQINQKVV
jgi:exodeoxyribonuclease III